MRIICSSCDKILGEQEPFDNPAEVKVKCLDCLEKEKEEASRFQPMPKPGEKLEVKLGNNFKGNIWVAAEEAEKLSPWELAVSGRRFSCSDRIKEDFQKYLIDIKDDAPEITFLYSTSISMKPPAKARRKIKNPTESKEKDMNIHYNCTARLPRYYIRSIFDEKAGRLHKFLDIIADGVFKTYKEECMAAYTAKRQSGRDKEL